MTLDLLSFATACVLGVSAGSLLTEALLLVPYWRTLKMEPFYTLHRDFGPRLFRYFAPLTSVAVLLPIGSAARGFLATGQHDPIAWLSAALIVAVTLTFPLYFRNANQAFADRKLKETERARELARWAKVHGFRTVLALLAFAASVSIWRARHDGERWLDVCRFSKVATCSTKIVRQRRISAKPPI